jgi:gamma-glutamyltranspeptidase/glutathione hydrolase
MRSFDIKAMGFQSVAATHIMVEAKRLAFEDRARFFADPDFAKTPSDHLLSDAYLTHQASRIKVDTILAPPPFTDAPHHGDTTTFSVADKDGMMISFIQSNYRGMGSGLVPDGLGFMFQNRGELFSLNKGSANIYGPGKRPFHTIIPGFATKDGKPWLAFAVMGGGMQPQGQAQIISNMLDHGLDLQEAGDAPRFNHEGSSEPTGVAAKGVGRVHLESGWPEKTVMGLEALGHKIGPSDGSFGGYQAVMRDAVAYAAASEMRKDGLALSY